MSAPAKSEEDMAAITSPRLRLTRRLAGNVHLGYLLFPADPQRPGQQPAGGPDGPPRRVTVAVKVRKLVRESDRGGSDGVRSWQEWRTVHRLLQLQRQQQRRERQRRPSQPSSPTSPSTEQATASASPTRHSEGGNTVADLTVSIMREESVAGGGGHRNVVRYYATFVETECFKLAMEYCACGDLLSLLATTARTSASNSFTSNTSSSSSTEIVATRRVPQETARRWVLQIARGLQYLHENGIAHRDLCLENVLLAGDPRTPECKIANFGASFMVNGATSAGSSGGKTRDRPPTTHHLHYTAPEVVSGRAAGYDPWQADIWSLGIILFVLLTGSPLLRLPFPGCKDLEVVRAIGCRGVLRLWGLETQFSAATLDLLDKMLAVEPARRLRSVAQVLEHPAMLAAARLERERERPGTRTGTSRVSMMSPP